VINQLTIHAINNAQEEAPSEFAAFINQKDMSRKSE
jgi:hypothetical protein